LPRIVPKHLLKNLANPCHKSAKTSDSIQYVMRLDAVRFQSG